MPASNFFSWERSFNRFGEYSSRQSEKGATDSKSLSPYGFMNNLDLILILSESDSYLTSSLIYAVGESDFMKRKSFCAYEFFVYLIGKETSLTYPSSGTMNNCFADFWMPEFFLGVLKLSSH